MSQAPSIPWYDRFFRHEYLDFDEHLDTNLEVQFLLGFLQPGCRILDVGCGYGRHLVPLGRKATNAVGIDRSPVMLSAARRRAAEAGVRLSLLRADMRALPFHGAFDLALSLFNSFGYFEDEDENFRVLQNIAGALREGGRFLIDTVNRDFVVRHFIPAQVYRPKDMVLVEERRFDPVASRSLVDVTVIRQGTSTHLHHSIRLYTYAELDMLLSAVGLAPVEVWGDFRGGDYTWDSPHMIVLAEKP